MPVPSWLRALAAQPIAPLESDAVPPVEDGSIWGPTIAAIWCDPGTRIPRRVDVGWELLSRDPEYEAPEGEERTNADGIKAFLGGDEVVFPHMLDVYPVEAFPVLAARWVLSEKEGVAAGEIVVAEPDDGWWFVLHHRDGTSVVEPFVGSAARQAAEGTYYERKQNWSEVHLLMPISPRMSRDEAAMLHIFGLHRVRGVDERDAAPFALGERRAFRVRGLSAPRPDVEGKRLLLDVFLLDSAPNLESVGASARFFDEEGIPSDVRWGLGGIVRAMQIDDASQVLTLRVCVDPAEPMDEDAVWTFAVEHVYGQPRQGVAG